MEGVIDTRIQERFCFGLKTPQMGSLAAGGLWWGAETAFIDPTALSGTPEGTAALAGMANGILLVTDDSAGARDQKLHQRPQQESVSFLPSISNCTVLLSLRMDEFHS